MKKFIFVLFAVVSLGFISCHDKTQDIIIDEHASSNDNSPYRAPIQVTDMEYTSAHELYTLYINDPTNIIHFNVARLLAETELIAGANFALGPSIDPYDDWYLTPLPKVVYNYDNTPKYYEFGYVCNGQIVATITTYAQKEIAGVIAYIFSEPLNYDCHDVDYYIGDYPNRYYGTNGVCHLKTCDEELDFDLEEHGNTDEEERNLMFAQMSTEDIEGMEEDLNNSGESIDDDINERDEYWQLIDEYVENHYPDLISEDTPDLEPGTLQLHDFLDGTATDNLNQEPRIVDALIILLDYMVGYYNTYTLEEYSDPRLQVTRWTNFCGPAACSWVYRGKYDSYNGRYLPIYGDGDMHNGNNYYREISYGNYAFYNFVAGINHSDSLSYHTALYNFTTRSNIADNGLAACFYNEVVPFRWGGLWQFPLYHGGLNRGFRTATDNDYHVYFTCKPYDCILQDHQPVIIAVNCNHYIVAFGFGVTLKNNGNVKDKYFMITDNGTTTAPTYRPYMRKKNFWNLHYGLTH